MTQKTNITPHTSSLIGRQPEIADVAAHLATHRLVTLMGPGGSGKTRLAVEVARRVADQFADGVWLVELASIGNPHLVPQAVAAVLNVREKPGASFADSLAESVRDRNMLLVLDNCEHLIAPVTALIEQLLKECARVVFLTTSRQSLSVSGEAAWQVPPLAIPPAHSDERPSELAHNESVQLFVSRATAAHPEFHLDRRNGAAVAQVCRRLDGIPLAIELAAARMKLLTPQQVADRLDEAFRLFRGEESAFTPRHRTLHAAMAWSYDLLSHEEQRALRVLSVFVGTFSVSAAEAVMRITTPDPGPDHSADVLDLLERLVDRSLLQVDMSRPEARFRMLEVLRQFAHEHLEAAGEQNAALAAHGAWYESLAVQAEPELWEGDIKSWCIRLNAEHDNLRAALERSLEHDLQRGLQIGACLWRFWEFGGFHSEGRTWLERLITAAENQGGENSPAFARVLFGAGMLARNEGHLHRARARFERCLSMFRDQNDTRWTASTLRGLGLLAQADGDYAAARALISEAIDLFRDIRHELGVGWTLRNLAIIAQLEEDFPTAERLLRESLPILRRLNDRTGISRVLGSLGILARNSGRLAEARQFLEESLRLMTEVDDTRGRCMALNALATLARMEGKTAEASGLLTVCLEQSASIEEKESQARAVAATGLLQIERGNSARGTELITAAETGFPLLRSVLAADERDELDQGIALAREALGEEGFAVAAARGHIVGLEDALRSAQDCLTDTKDTPPNARGPIPAGLTPRETEVLQLVAEGRSNKEIAEALTISEYTVMRHMSNIFNKLGVSSRAAAAAFATREGLA